MTYTRAKTWLILCLCLTMASLSACAASESRMSRVGFYFDTVVTITAYASDAAILEDAMALCRTYECRLSKTIEESDVWKINHADGQPVAVSEDTLRILTVAQSISQASEGAFDVTVANAVALWDFIGGMTALPAETALAEAASKIDYTRVQIDANTVTVPPGVSIDLGGVAKGYIADCIAAYLKSRGVERALLNFGGNVVAVGEKPNGAWTVGIQDPDDPSGVLAVLTATDKAVVTSGIYERGFTFEGVRYHHILDTATGWPVQNELSSVTIITESSLYADALSTAAFALGLTKGMAWIESLPEVEAIFVTRDRAIYATPGAADRLIA